MSDFVTCPHCAARDLDLGDYKSIMVIDPHFAVFTLACPHCGATIAAVHAIPPKLRETIRFAAKEVGAGMGRSV